MAKPNAFGMRMREIRQARNMSVQELADALCSRAWRGMEASAARARVNNLELGRLINVSHAECNEIERIIGADAEELWKLLLQDPRKVDPEVRVFYESHLDALSEGFAEAATAALKLSQQKKDAPALLKLLLDLKEHTDAIVPLLSCLTVMDVRHPGFTGDLVHVLASALRDDIEPQRHWSKVDGALGLASLVRGLRELEPGVLQAWLVMTALSLPTGDRQWYAISASAPLYTAALKSLETGKRFIHWGDSEKLEEEGERLASAFRDDFPDEDIPF